MADPCGCTPDATPDATPDSTPDTAEPATGGPSIACTLAANDVEDRLAAWRSLLAHAREVRPLADGVHVDFDNTVSAVDVAALAEAEHACCAFMSFTVAIDDGVALTVCGPADALPVIDALLGLPSRPT